jgi:hypothetical protein
MLCCILGMCTFLFYIVELVCGGFVINRATQSSFTLGWTQTMYLADHHIYRRNLFCLGTAYNIVLWVLFTYGC